MVCTHTLAVYCAELEALSKVVEGNRSRRENSRTRGVTRALICMPQLSIESRGYSHGSVTPGSSSDMRVTPIAKMTGWKMTGAPVESQLLSTVPLISQSSNRSHACPESSPQSIDWRSSGSDRPMIESIPLVGCGRCCMNSGLALLGVGERTR